MTPEEARIAIEQILLQIVPDANFDDIPDDAELREELDLDSLDFLVFVERLSVRTHCRLDEDDYPSLGTMNSCIDLLVGRTAGGPFIRP